MGENVLKVEKRTVIGREVKKLRAEGLIPGIVYGAKTEAVPFQVGASTLEKLLAQVQNQLFDLVVGDEAPRKVLVQEVQRHPVRRALLHVDFQQVNLTEKREIEVPLVIVGSSPLVRENTYMLNQQLSEVIVRCLPADIPGSIEVDVSVLTEPDLTITAGDLTLPEKVELVTPADDLVVGLTTTRAMAAEEEVTEEEEEEEEVEPGEVEVIKRGRGEAEEEES